MKAKFTKFKFSRTLIEEKNINVIELFLKIMKNSIFWYIVVESVFL